MARRRLRMGEKLAGAGGVALLVSTFLPWYSEPEALSAWQAFSVVDLLLGLTALMGVALAVFAAARPEPALPVATSVLLIALCTVVVPLTLYRLLNQPGSNGSVDVRLGAYLGLGCVLAIAVGSWRALADEGAREDPAPAVPARPAPPTGLSAATPASAGGSARSVDCLDDDAQP